MYFTFFAGNSKREEMDEDLEIFCSPK